MTAILESKEEESSTTLTNIDSLNSLIQQKTLPSDEKDDKMPDNREDSKEMATDSKNDINQAQIEPAVIANTVTTDRTLPIAENGSSSQTMTQVVKEGKITKEKNEKQLKARRENGLRRGKWTQEEEAYANRLIHEFKLGLLPLTDGTTLRTFLSKLLHCDPMRISKKFVGSNCIGKQVFRRRQADMDRLSPEDIKRSRYELAELERRFLSRVANTSRTVKSSATSGNANNQIPNGSVNGGGNTNGSQRLRGGGSQGFGMCDTAGMQPDFVHQQPVMAPWLLPPHTTGATTVQSVRAGAGAVAIAAPYGLGPSSYAGPSVQQKQQQQQQNVVFSQQSAREQISSSTMGSASGSTAVSRRAPAPAAHQEFAYHSIARSVMAPVPAQWMSAGPSDAFRYPTEPQHVTSYRAPQCYDQGNNSPSSGEAEREEATDKLGRLEDIGTQRSRLERHRSDGPYGNNLVAHPSHASLTSFDLPSFNSMDNLALLDSAGSIGFNSPWPSNMNLASQASSFNHNNDFALVNRQASENNLAQILEQQVSRGGDGGSGREAVYQFVSHQHNGPPPSSLQMVGNGAINDYNGIASRHHANQKQDHNGAMPSWPSFNALVAGMEDSQSLVAAQKLTQRADIKNQSIANTAATDEVDLPDPEQQGLRSRTASDRPLERGGPIVHRHSAPDFPATVNAEISRHAIKSSPKQQIRRQNRNSSVENFLSLVHSGDIPAPDANLLSSPILQQINGSSAGQTSGATRKRAVCFSIFINV
uniref:Uncharacterized protein n=1 Tax=Aureoumbra lagunensis TaxID=44058 RepID=A0A7S3K268_9STRA